MRWDRECLAGDSDEAKTFNCIQRGHQQALETYTSFVVLSLIGGLKFPVLSAMSGLVWGVARIQVRGKEGKGIDRSIDRLIMDRARGWTVGRGLRDRRP